MKDTPAPSSDPAPRLTLKGHGNPFETETMAELCVRQGHRANAVAIYRRLLERAGAPLTRQRLTARLVVLESDPAAQAITPPPTPVPDALGPPAPLAQPGLRATAVGDDLTVDWKLPPSEPRPRELQLLLVLRTDTGVATETRSFHLESESGRLELYIPNLHSARAAAGYRREKAFIPLLRTP